MLTDTDYHDRMRHAERAAMTYSNGDTRRYTWNAVAWMNRHMLDISEVAVEHYCDFENPDEADIIGECERFFGEGEGLAEDVEIALAENEYDEDFVDWKCEEFLEEAKSIAKSLGMTLKRYDVWD